jgi:uncharacterized protein YecA (UPF0149 family)
MMVRPKVQKRFKAVVPNQFTVEKDSERGPSSLPKTPMEEKLHRLEEMMGTLIQMVGSTNARLEEISQDLKETKGELKRDIEKLIDGQERQTAFSNL